MKPTIAVPAIATLLYRAHSRRSLTPSALLTAGLTATAHAVHPWSVFFALLGAFFLAGTAVTKVNHAKKSTLTTTAKATQQRRGPGKQQSGDANAPHPRNATQVLCNSLPATLAILAHAYYLSTVVASNAQETPLCLPRLSSSTTFNSGSFAQGDLPALPGKIATLLPFAVLAHYASAAADTFSSELGILSDSSPVLITDVYGLLKLNPKKVLRGTNGGVTILGTLAGLGGAGLMGLVTIALMPFCSSWTFQEKVTLLVCVTAVGGLGSILDSILGALFQASVIDVQTSKVIEGEGGVKVDLHLSSGPRKGSRSVINGRDVLSNNGVNLLMCSLMSLVGMSVAFLASTAAS